jgi:hypothetical protein
VLCVMVALELRGPSLDPWGGPVYTSAALAVLLGPAGAVLRYRLSALNGASPGLVALTGRGTGRLGVGRPSRPTSQTSDARRVQASGRRTSLRAPSPPTSWAAASPRCSPRPR